MFFAFPLPPDLPPFGFSLGKVLPWASAVADVPEVSSAVPTAIA